MGDGTPDRLSRWEILGRVATAVDAAARGGRASRAVAEKVAVGGVLLLVAAAVGVVALLNTESDRDAAAQRGAARRGGARACLRSSSSVERRQAPRRGRAPADPESVPARRALLDSARAEMSAGAADREIDCEPFPKTLDTTPPVADLARAAAAYDCLAVKSRFATGTIGTPFRLVVHFDSGRYAWCEIVPLGDRDRLSHPLPDACRL